MYKVVITTPENNTMTIQTDERRMSDETLRQQAKHYVDACRKVGTDTPDHPLVKMYWRTSKGKPRRSAHITLQALMDLVDGNMTLKELWQS